MGRTPAWRSQSYRVMAGKRERWGPRGTQREQELYLGHLGGLPGGEISRAGPWGKKNLQARKRHSSLRAQHKSHLSSQRVKGPGQLEAKAALCVRREGTRELRNWALFPG